jgi:hypothetical protein
MKPNYILKKDLPNCPKGNVFKPTYDGTDYFLSLTDNEHINGNFPAYKFRADVVENNPNWFKKETESDLLIQLKNAIRKKQDAENKIRSLKKTLSKK